LHKADTQDTTKAAYKFGRPAKAKRWPGRFRRPAKAKYPADELLLSFLLLTSTSVFQIDSGTGLDIQ
jgi:hypothetical protein